jgi:2-oxoglutarate ferredoxin oxidoreductase subunit alpha
MSPATGIMLHLAAHQDDLPVVVEQAEDEIAAVNMVIGAAYAGVRSITATSGGGFCLMCEGLGLAGISETPLVIVNAQRPGPATGLATRTAQGDLQFVIRAAQDDFPRFVFAPGSFQQGYETTARALALAEKYQTPAVVLVDQYFNDSLQVTDKPFAAPDTVERFIDTDESLDNPEQYKRYAPTESGISPRALPCRGRALVMTLGNTHGEDGHLSESAHDRNAMVDKRARKMRSMLSEMLPPESGYPGASLLLVCWGSLKGIVREAVEMMRSKGIDAGWVHFCDIWPFPARDAKEIVGKADRFIVVEQNSTAQFAQLVRQETGLVPSGTVLKYDGRPFYPSEIAFTVEQMEK